MALLERFLPQSVHPPPRLAHSRQRKDNTGPWWKREGLEEAGSLRKINRPFSPLDAHPDQKDAQSRGKGPREKKCVSRRRLLPGEGQLSSWKRHREAEPGKRPEEPSVHAGGLSRGCRRCLHGGHTEGQHQAECQLEGRVRSAGSRGRAPSVGSAKMKLHC